MQGYFLIDGTPYPIRFQPGPRLADGRSFTCNQSQLTVGGIERDVEIARDGNQIWIHIQGCAHRVIWQDAVTFFEQDGQLQSDLVSRAPMPGSVVDLIVSKGQRVAAGEALLVIESMKLETTIRASVAGIVHEIHVGLGESFQRDTDLVTLEAEG